MTQTGGNEHQGRISIRESIDNARLSSDLPHDPLQGIAGSDPVTVITWKIIIGQGLINAVSFLAAWVAFAFSAS